MAKHSHKVDGRPSMQWYPNDPLNDVGLKLCSLGAQGLWYNMLWYMYFSPERGVLLQPNGEKVGVPELAALVGKPVEEIEQYLSELDSRKVFSKASTGAIYSRREVRDEKQRRSKAEAGRRGGSVLMTEAKVQAKPGSSSSTSSSSSASTPSSVEKDKDSWVVPKQLSGLTLYEIDRKLCEKLPSVYPLWEDAYPYLNLMKEIKSAHLWEVSRPRRRKKDRIRFLTTWMGNADEDRAKQKNQSGQTIEDKAKAMRGEV